MDNATAAKHPWQPFGRGRRIGLGKRTKSENALNTKGEDVFRERANERISSKASRRSLDASFGMPRR